MVGIARIFSSQGILIGYILGSDAFDLKKRHLAYNILLSSITSCLGTDNNEINNPMSSSKSTITIEIILF